MCKTCYEYGHYGESCNSPRSRILIEFPMMISLNYEKKSAKKAVITQDMITFEKQCKRKFGISNKATIYLYSEDNEFITDVKVLKHNDTVALRRYY